MTSDIGPDHPAAVHLRDYFSALTPEQMDGAVTVMAFTALQMLRAQRGSDFVEGFFQGTEMIVQNSPIAPVHDDYCG